MAAIPASPVNILTRLAPAERLVVTGPVLLVGFVVAVRLRVAVGGTAVATSMSAGLIFAAALTILTLAAGAVTRVSWAIVGWGVFGAAVLCLPPLLAHLTGPGHRPAGSYLPWAAAVTVVAVAEEAFLRGAVFDALDARTRRFPVALLVTSACFALLHVPLYGWHAVPLDLAVGLWLGALRRTTGSWTAPALCHTLADLAGWWLL
jgi:membrane protease YdiL (CAAX protease family)